MQAAAARAAHSGHYHARPVGLPPGGQRGQRTVQRNRLRRIEVSLPTAGEKIGIAVALGAGQQIDGAVAIHVRRQQEVGTHRQSEGLRRALEGGCDHSAGERCKVRAGGRHGGRVATLQRERAAACERVASHQVGIAVTIKVGEHLGNGLPHVHRDGVASAGHLRLQLRRAAGQRLCHAAFRVEMDRTLLNLLGTGRAQHGTATTEESHHKTGETA